MSKPATRAEFEQWQAKVTADMMKWLREGRRTYDEAMRRWGIEFENAVYDGLIDVDSVQEVFLNESGYRDIRRWIKIATP